MHGLDLALGAFDALGDHLGLNGHVVVNLGALHEPADAIHAIPAEQAHEVILEREVELRGARVSLAAGTTAQLVVDAS